MLNLVREGEEDYIEAIRYRRRLKIFENFLFSINNEQVQSEKDRDSIFCRFNGLQFKNCMHS